MKITNLNKDLVFHCPLDAESFNLATNRFTDKSAHCNHGTSANIATFGADRMGQEYRATVLNGSSDYTNCGLDTSLQINVNSTVSAWVSHSNGAGMSVIAANCASGGYNGFYFSIYQNNLRIQFSNWAGRYVMAQSVGVVPDEWTHVAGTYDGTEIELYINGIQQSLSLDEQGSGAYTISDQLCIGARDNGLESFFTGSIAEVRIYNRILSASELVLINNSYRNKLIINVGNPKLIV